MLFQLLDEHGWVLFTSVIHICMYIYVDGKTWVKNVFTSSYQRSTYYTFKGFKIENFVDLTNLKKNSTTQYIKQVFRTQILSLEK